MNSNTSTDKILHFLCEGQNLSPEDLQAISEKAEMYDDLMKILGCYIYFEQNKDRIDWQKFFIKVEMILVSKNLEERDAIGFWVLESLPAPEVKEAALPFEFFKDLLGPESMSYYLAYNQMMDKLPEFFKNLNSKK